MKGSKRYAKATICCMAVLVSGLVLSCSDDWDAHYDGVPRPTRTLWQEITARPELSDLQNCLKDTVTTSSWIRANAIRFGHHPAA